MGLSLSIIDGNTKIVGLRLVVALALITFTLASVQSILKRELIAKQRESLPTSLASDLTIDLRCDYCRSINEDTINVTKKERNKNVY